MAEQTQHNYHRALIWSAVMTVLSHLDSNFGSVTAIEAVNEPIMDASQTPGYGNCEFCGQFFRTPPDLYGTVQKNFVQVVRGVELALGISVPGFETQFNSLPVSVSLTAALAAIGTRNIFNAEVASVLTDAAPIILKIANQFSLSSILNFSRKPVTASLLSTKCVDIRQVL